MTDARYLRAKAQIHFDPAARAGKLEAFAEKIEGETEDILHRTDRTNNRDLPSPKWRPHRQVCLNCNRDMLPIFRDGGSKFPEPIGFQCRPCGLTIIGRMA